MRKLFKKTLKKSPGTLIYVGDEDKSHCCLDLINYNSEEYYFHENISSQEIRSKLINNGVNWLNVVGLQEIDKIKDLGNEFGIDSLILEDIVNTEQRPKIDENNNFVFLTLKRFTEDKTALFNEKPEQISIYFTDNTVITFLESQDIFDDIKNRIKSKSLKIRYKNADYLFYSILDYIVDLYYYSIENFDQDLDKLEDKIFEEPNENVLREIQDNKILLLTMKRNLYPLRDAINKLQKRDLPIIDDSIQKNFNDVYDHTVHIVETIESFREINSGLRDMYLSSISLKMNKIMQVLTIIATIFIPLTFVVGVYGMNFDFMPELHWKYGYPAVWVLILLIALFLIIYFKSKKWF